MSRESAGSDRWLLRIGLRRLLENPSDRRGSDSKPGAAEHLGLISEVFRHHSLWRHGNIKET